MKKLLVVAVAMMISAVASAAIQHTSHDLSNQYGSNEICVFCHTPHGALIGQYAPLWNRDYTPGTFTLYSSPTLDATVGQPGAQSTACMSCHDGTLGLGDLYNQSNASPATDTTTMISGAALLGTDLSNDHPVGFVYDATLMTADTELNDPSALVGPQLFSGHMECATCHDVHDNTNGAFLIMTNSGSQLCLACHAK